MKQSTLTIVTLAALIGLNSHPEVSQSRQPLSSHSTATSSDRGIVAANTRKKSSPPSSGSCKTPQGTIQNCWRGVVWEAVPNSYSEFAGGYAYVGKNTIIRKGNLINFDFYGDGTYVRYSGNCKAGVLAIAKASDNVFVDPNQYFRANDYQRRGLNFACAKR